ncbi:glycosyltransferase family 4 protein [Leeuwenhoekiella sp. A16]|uniref:glycosyltransferase family 4 protein n=1 Tax=Leeuwenhoekiella sp. A16 TaxID=3141462 RepID=UPI003A809D94
MHIGFITPEFPHERSTHSGGLGTSIKNLAISLVQNGAQVSVFIYAQKENHLLKWEGIDLYFVKNQQYKILGWYLHRKFLQRYINKQILLNKIDVIEAPDWTGITAFMKFKCPLVIRFHGSDAYFCKLEERKQKKKNFWFEKLALEGADYLVSVSKFTAEVTRDIFQLKKEISVIPNSINTSLFKPLSSKRSTEDCTLLYFGTIIRKKGVLEIPEIFNLVYNEDNSINLRVIGKDVIDIKTKKSTKKLMREGFNPDALQNVCFIEELIYEDIKAEIEAAAIIILPSFAEALPMTWLEAMAMQKALVTSDIGWAKEIMEDGETGFTENPKNHLLYAEKLLKLARNRDLREKMGTNARSKILNSFSTEVISKRNIEFYKTVISQIQS